MKIKRLLSAALAACLTLTLVLPASAAGSAAQEAEAAQAVRALGIMVGDPSGDMHLADPVTRAEFITMAMKATPGGEQIGQAASSPYPDVPRSHWASGYVEAGVARGLISGYTDGTFRPNSHISLAEGATIVLHLLGYGPEDLSGAYPTGQLAMYRSLRLDRNLTASAAGDTLTRRDAMFLFYNLMTAKGKDGVAYLLTLGHSLNSAGEIDLLSLLNDSMEGPLVAERGWQSRLSFTPAQVYRNGAPSSLDAVRDYDVVYWNPSMATLWVCSDKITGSIQALEPSSAAPTAVTVAGRTCAIETSAAAYALSDLGQYRLGDTVTLLLGRDGGVAAVVPGTAAADSRRVGMVTRTDTASYPDGKGGSYTVRTVTLLSTDGQSYQYPYTSGSYRAGDLVQVTLSDSGDAALRRLSSSSLTGRVDAAGTKVGSEVLAADVEILDVSGQYGVKVFPSRLAGLTLNSGAVKYFSRNTAGEIDCLILNDVTGDMHHYGVLLRMDTQSAGELSSLYSYELDVEGQRTTIPASSTRYPVETGPIRIQGAPEAPEKLYSLTSARTGTLDGSQFVTGERKYTLSDSVAVYEYRSGGYYLSSLARVRAGNFTLTGWYDKAENQGGRIRVIVAREG